MEEIGVSGRTIIVLQSFDFRRHVSRRTLQAVIDSVRLKIRRSKSFINYGQVNIFVDYLYKILYIAYVQLYNIIGHTSAI